MKIGIAGLAGSGKDTVAGLLAMHGYERIAFGDALRAEAFEWLTGQRSLEPFHVADGVRMIPADVLRAYYGLMQDPAEIYRKPTSPRARLLLQWWGTDFRRAQEDGYWVARLLDSIKPGRNYSIPDVRFPDEANVCDILLLVERPGIQQMSHKSEDLSWIGHHKFSALSNNGHIVNLAQQVLEALSRWDAPLLKAA